MDRLRSLEVFVAVAEAGSFAAGARAAGLSAPSATRGINTLEARLGARLFTRTTRTVRLTDVGEAYLEDARRILSELQAADDAAAGASQNPVGTLRLTCPNEFGRLYIMPLVTAFLDTYPAMHVDVLLVDRIVSLVDEGLDLAVRIGPLPPSGLSAVRVGAVRRVVCGAPHYFASRGRPSTPADLEAHRIVAIGTGHTVAVWRFGGDEDAPVRLRARLSVSSVGAALDAARAGWGLCRVLSYQVATDVAAGRLETVLQAHEPKALPIHLVHAEGRRAVAKVRSFVDFAVEHLRSNTLLHGPAAASAPNPGR